VKQACHILQVWRPTIDAAINGAVTAGNITSAQAATLTAWLNGAQAACDIVRLVSGY